MESSTLLLRPYLLKLALGALLSWALFTLTPVQAANEYGTFTLSSGEARILHASNLNIVKDTKPVKVFEDDTIQMSANSNGELKGKDKVDMQIGAYAVLKVQPWKQNQDEGFLSLIYGKVKATIAGLRANESFNVKTANSIIGVKGTQYAAATDDRGNTVSAALTDFVYMHDLQKGTDAIVPQGYYMSNFEGAGLQAMIPLTTEMVQHQNDPSLLSSSPQGGKPTDRGALDQALVPVASVGTVQQKQVLDLNQQLQQLKEQTGAPKSTYIQIKVNIKLNSTN